jgi:hypothetical protein
MTAAVKRFRRREQLTGRNISRSGSLYCMAASSNAKTDLSSTPYSDLAKMRVMRVMIAGRECFAFVRGESFSDPTERSSGTLNAG